MRDLRNVICLDISVEMNQFVLSGVTQFCDLVLRNEAPPAGPSVFAFAGGGLGAIVGLDEMQDMLAGRRVRHADNAVLKISSPGGDIHAAFSMHDRLRELRTPVIGFAVGSVMSAAVLPFIACQERVATPATTFVIHQGMSNMQGYVDARQLGEQYAIQRRLNATMAEVIAQACKKSVRSVRHDVAHSRTLSAKEALKYGLIHEIVDRLEYSAVASLRTVIQTPG